MGSSLYISCILSVAFAVSPLKYLSKSMSEGDENWAYCNSQFDAMGRPCESGWGSSFEECAATSTSQSPINLLIPSTKPRLTTGGLSFTSGLCPYATIVSGASSGHGWNVEFSTNPQCQPQGSFIPLGTSYVTFNGVNYYLQQFHFHSPSEHTVNGMTFDMEVHLVHASSSGAYLVIGVFASATDATNNLYFDKFWPSGFAATANTTSAFAPYWMLPADRTLHHYMGSLTTPPCTEGVLWFQFINPVTMSLSQLQSFKTALGQLNQTAAAGRNNRSPMGLTNTNPVYQLAATDSTITWSTVSPSPSPSPSPDMTKKWKMGVAAFAPVGIAFLLLIILWERFCDRPRAGGEERWKSGSAVAPGATTAPSSELQVTATPV